MRNQPIPLRLDPDRLQRDAVVSLSRAALAHARHALDPKSTPLEIAKRTFDGDRAVELIVRGATGPAMTSVASWAGVFATIENVFLASLAGPSAAAALLNRGLQVRFDGYGAVSLPTISAGQASFVGENQAIPVVQFATASGVLLSPCKLALISLLTREMIDGSNAEQIITAVLKESASIGLDSVLFSASIATPDQPAGLLSGVAALTPSTATPLTEAMVADLSALGGAVSRIAGNEIIFIAAPEQSFAIALRAPDLGFPILTSKALAKGTVIAVAANALVSGFDPVPVVSASIDPTIVPDTAPPGLIVPPGGAFTNQTWSMFQSDRVALKMRMNASWALRSPNAIAFMNSVAW
jgi:hypothetical protein